MSTVAQISLDSKRGEQLSKIMEIRGDLPRDQSKAVRELLFEYFEKILAEC